MQSRTQSLTANERRPRRSCPPSRTRSRPRASPRPHHCRLSGSGDRPPELPGDTRGPATGHGLSRYCTRPSSTEVSTVTTGAVHQQPHALRAAAGLLHRPDARRAPGRLALWLLDRRLKTAKRAQVAFGYPVVAEIPLRLERFDRALPHALAVGLPRAAAPAAVGRRASGGTRGRTRCWTRVSGAGRARRDRHEPAGPTPRSSCRLGPARGPQRGDGHLAGVGAVSGRRRYQPGHASAPRSVSGWRS